MTELQPSHVDWQLQLHVQHIDLVCGCCTAVGLHDKHLDSVASELRVQGLPDVPSHAGRQAEPACQPFIQSCYSMLCVLAAACIAWPSAAPQHSIANPQPACQIFTLYVPLFCARLRVVLQSQEVPDVWLQVLARCARSYDCESEAIDELVSLTTAQQIGEPDAVPYRHASCCLQLS
jgi:hypothetical protein